MRMSTDRWAPRGRDCGSSFADIPMRSNPLQARGDHFRSPGSRRRSPLAPNDPVFITRAIEAKPFPSAPNVVVSYPHREEWWNRYPAVRKSYSGDRSYHEFEWPYQDSKCIYQDRVLKRLRQIQHRATGRAVLAELRARPSYSVYIFPWVFLPSIDWRDRDALGLTEALQIPQ